MVQHQRQHGLWGRVIEWFGVGHGLHSIIQSELVRTVIIPAIMTLVTGTAGVLGGIPVMREYLRQWIASPRWEGWCVPILRHQIDGLTTRELIGTWIDLAVSEGIDPL